MAHRLTVRISEHYNLDAGIWEERIDENQEPYRLITPPAMTMYEQVLAYLMETIQGQKAPAKATLDFEEVAIATVAICIRWGSYFAVLSDPEIPLWLVPEEASAIGDAEMARLNIEMSAALAHWLELIHTNNPLFRTLVKAAIQFLPMSIGIFDTTTHAREFRTFTFFNSKKGREELLLSMKQRLGEQFIKQRRQRVLRTPLRALANGVLNESWRNGPIEDIHAGSLYLPRPLTQRRISPDDEKTVLTKTTGHLVPIMHALYRFITHKSEETLDEKILPYAILFKSPDNWSMTEKTRIIKLPDKEP
jgi:hypothetical protein